MKFLGSNKPNELFLQAGGMALLESSTLEMSKTLGYSLGRMINSLIAGNDICPPKKKDKKVSKF